MTGGRESGQAGWKLVTYQAKTGPKAGVLAGDVVYEASALGLSATVLDLLNDWEASQHRIGEALQSVTPDAGTPLAAVELLAPVLYPGTIFLAGINYHDHRQEMAERRKALGESGEVDEIEAPWHTVVASRPCVVGTGARVAIPGENVNLDWEAELAVIIGKRASKVTEATAMAYVAGYTIANDLSARALSRRKDVRPSSTFRIDWMRHKSFDGACPLGPAITPAAQVADPHQLGIRLWVGDALMQDSNTNQMIFGIAAQIARISETTTLCPGDVILTGCPAGTGSSHGRYLEGGDTVTVEIDGLGQLETHII
ncbi:fumarylacetoacetate hydrolase family protein [Oceanicola sp. D3]|uniref:fumarylacetoacetate hydrolase family protein n=1 Tax=Oceanicola sp. D3 TaxID=2587163 RepID=UPI001122B474|nr:fumarylacetoacetate hydrolase family protein [Oceanicola sp. D3]QDC08613.1 fumarylacetoacetate hydrolase family protein [Oceanicola sp. D3]